MPIVGDNNVLSKFATLSICFISVFFYLNIVNILFVTFVNCHLSWIFFCPKLIAVAARDINRAQDFAEKLKFKKAYGSYDDVANDRNVGEETIYVRE